MRMCRTPLIPSDFRSFVPSECPDKHPFCCNAKAIYELKPDESKVFGTEKMVTRGGDEVLNKQHAGNVVDWRFGDWCCDVLFLMQDAAPWPAIAERIEHGHPDPFSARNFTEKPRNAGGAGTNRNLHGLARNLDCRKLAGSVLAGVLKGGEKYRGKVDPLLGCARIRDHLRSLLRWVVDPAQTRHLRVVVCLGRPSWDFVSQEVLPVTAADRERLESTRGAVARSIGSQIHLAYLWHPQQQVVNSVGRAKVVEAWRRLSEEAGIPWRERPANSPNPRG